MKFFLIIEFLILGAIDGLMALFAGSRKDNQAKSKEVEPAEV